MKTRISLLEEKKIWTRSTLQNAAKKVFLKKGFANATMEEISKAAGVSKGALYLYFKNKDDLYFSLTFPVLSKINESLQKLRDRLINKKCRNHKELVMGFYMHYKNIYKYDPEGLRIIQKYQLGDLVPSISRKNREELNRYTRNNFEIARNIFSRAIDLNLIPQINPVILSDWFWSTFIGIVQFEESKLKITKKDHVLSTLEEVFMLISNTLCPDRKLIMAP